MDGPLDRVHAISSAILWIIRSGMSGHRLRNRVKGDDLIIENLSLQVRRGEIYGFIGLNGAGKTTTIRMLLGMVRPTKGSAYLLGQPVHAGRSGVGQFIAALCGSVYPPPMTLLR
ncbi:MAG TPA: ATP-binding cassette domain-containing protein [Limnochordia bacterium]|nr:ATP-binding cassette domain-containing protein [Limnochordia bacterium]